MTRPTIETDANDLIIRIPLKAQRSNPWDVDWYEEMDSIVGVIAGREMGFAHWIDMSYKGKADQVSDFFYQIFWMERDRFRELCEDLGIDIVEYPDCAECGEPIMGCSTWGDKGHICYQCGENTNEKTK